MARSIQDYEMAIQKATEAGDTGAVQFFTQEIENLKSQQSKDDNTDQLFNARVNAENANDPEAVAYFNQQISETSEFGNTGLKDDDLVFDKLTVDNDYSNALVEYYSKKDNRPRFGNVDKMYDKDNNFIGNEEDINSLKEKNFEYWNATNLNMLQMGQTAYELMKSTDKEKDNVAKLFDTYERTKMTGEGSRNGLEQIKDAWHLVYDPTTWMGGKFVMGPAQKAASKKAILAALRVKKNSVGEPVSKFSQRALLKTINNADKGMVTKSYGLPGASKIPGVKKLGLDSIVESQKVMGKKARLSLKKKLLAKGLSRQETDKILKSVAYKTAGNSALLSGGLIGVYDVGLQAGVLNQLDDEREFSLTQTAASTIAGGGIGAIIPGAGKLAAKAISKPGQMALDALPRIKDRVKDPLGVIRNPLVKAFGGKKAAREGITEEGLEKFAEIEPVSAASAAETASLNLNVAKKQGFKKFEEEFGELGLLENPGEISLPNKLDDIVKGIAKDTADATQASSLSQIMRNMVNPNPDIKITPSEALRKFRSTIGEQYQKSITKGSADKEVWKAYDKEIRDLFNNQAKTTLKRDGQGNLLLDADGNTMNKLKDAKLVDSRYKTFIETITDDTMKKMLGKGSEAQATMKRAMSSNNSSLIKEHLANIKTIARFSDNPVSVENEYMEQLRNVSSEVLFGGVTGASFKRYLSNQDGISVLRRIYPKLAEDGTISKLAKIHKNAETGSNVGMYAMRLATVAVAGTYGFGAGGPLGTASVGIAYVAVESMLSSKVFQRMSMKTFSSNKTKGLSEALALTKFVKNKFPNMTDDDLSESMNLILGGTLWAGVLANDSGDGWLSRQKDLTLKFAGNAGEDVMRFLNKEDKSKSFDDTVKSLGVDSIPGFDGDQASRYKQNSKRSGALSFEALSDNPIGNAIFN